MKQKISTASYLSFGVGLLVVLYFILFQPFSTGYGFERSALWSDMKMGYKMEDGEWMFGYAVPFLVAALFWMTRERFKDITIKGAWMGLPLVILGLFLYYGGYKANEKYVGYAALQILVAGIVIWHLGITYFLRAFWLWALLGMMWPWIILIDKVSLPLQKIMTTFTAGALGIIGEDFIKEGTMIRSAPTSELVAGERFSLTVAAACSGLRSFFALAMISLFYGYLTLKKDLNRLILFLSSAVLAIAGNVVRMMMLYAGTIWFGKEFAIGLDEFNPSHYHIGAGLVVFVVALTGMVALASLLERKKRKKVVTHTV